MLLTERIRSLAEPLNMTFASIEREIGIGRGTIRKWDTNCPAADRLLKVANLLNTTTDFLLTGTDNHQGNLEITLNDKELLDLFHQLPMRNQIKLIGYVERMVDALLGETINSSKKTKGDYDWVDWDKIANEKPSVAADEPLKKTGTTNSAKY